MSILRPEKRDPNYVRNKSDIGLSKVDNVSSAEFTSIVLDQVRRYLNRETIYQTLGRRFIALAKISCKDDGSGNTVKILSGNLFITFAVLNESEEVREAVKLETIYSHYVNGTEIDYEDDNAKVEYNIFMTENPTLLNECYLEFRENQYDDAKGTTITEMYVILRCDSENLPFVSTNLFEYSNGGVALDPTIIDDATLSSYSLIRSAKLDHNRFSLVDRSEATIGFEIYDDNGNPFRVIENHPDPINPDFDIPKINGIPFTGRKNVFVEGRNTRQIEINAKHTGSNLLEAGEHDWEVLTYAPRAGHSYYDANEILRDNTYPQVASFLDKDSFVANSTNPQDNVYENYGYGLCRLSGCGGTSGDGIILPNRMSNTEMQLGEKAAFLYEWSDSLSKVDTDVISVRIFKTFVDSVAFLFNDTARYIAGLRDAISNSKLPDFLKEENFKGNLETLGYHYIFDYAKTSDSVTIVPHTGMDDKTCEIKLGVVGNGHGTQTITIAQEDPFERGGDTDWVRVSNIDRSRDDSASVTFSFAPNKTNSSRYGYYIINSNSYSTDGSRIKLLYRFYQNVITSSLRVKFTDKNGFVEYYGLGAEVKKEIDNIGDILTFDNICIVDTSILDERGEPTRVDRILGYYIDNRFETSNVKVDEIRNEDGNRILGFQTTFPKNNTNDERKAEIHITQNNVDVFVLSISQRSRDFEFNAPDSITVGGYKGSTADFEITSNKDWVIEVIKGGSYVIIQNNGGDDKDTVSGSVPNSSDEKTFKRKIKVLRDNTSDISTEVAILKLYAAGEGSKSKRISVFQNSQPAIANIGTTQINIPYYEGGKETLEDFFCTYDWNIVVDSDLAQWCKISPEKGDRCEDITAPSYTELTFETLKRTESINPENRGTFTIKYAGKETIVNVVQDRAGFEFKNSSIDNKVTLGYAKNSSASINVESNYDWTIEISHLDPYNKKFTACVDNVSGKITGTNDSDINITAISDSLSDQQDAYLGEIKIYSLTQLIDTIEVYQEKVGLVITADSDSSAGWYANGDSKQLNSTNGDVTIPIKFAPITASVSALYTVGDSTLPIQAKVVDSDTTGEKKIIIPTPGDNINNPSERNIKVTVTNSSNGLTKDTTFTLKQNGYNNGISIDEVPYYGGVRTPENEIYFPPTYNTKKSAKTYAAVPSGNKLSMTKPVWLDISSDFKTRSTNAINMSGQTRSGEILITSGSDRDITKVRIPVYQYSGSWYFGEKNSSYINYTQASPLTKNMDAANGSETSLDFWSGYTYGNVEETENITVSFTETCNWCTVSSSKIATGKWKISFISSSANTGSERSAIAKVTQGNTGNTCFIKITQKAAASLKIYGGISGVTYILTTSSKSELSVNETQGYAIVNNATKFVGKSDDGILETYGNINNIMYVDDSGNVQKLSSLGVTSGKTLYVNSLNYSNNKVTKITNKYSKTSAGMTTYASIKLDGGDKNIYIQTFGSNRVKLKFGAAYLDGYEYLLTNTTTYTNWDTSRMDLSRCYYLSYDEGMGSESYFSVDQKLGVGYMTSGSSTTPSYTKSPITLYVWRKHIDSPSSTWQHVGTCIWNPLLDNPEVSSWV